MSSTPKAADAAHWLRRRRILAEGVAGRDEGAAVRPVALVRRQQPARTGLADPQGEGIVTVDAVIRLPVGLDSVGDR